LLLSDAVTICDRICWGKKGIEDKHFNMKPPNTYWITRFVMLRLTGFIYAIAFAVAINQIVPLIGEHGLTPLEIYFQRISAMLGSKGAGFRRLPSLFWFAHSDHALLITAWIGFLLSLVVLAGYANAIILALLWIFYMSFVHAGQDWYSYGWEIQMLETGFLTIFLCPLLDMRPFPKRPPPMPIIILFRCLIFRIMLGAGMIKVRGDNVWRNWTALYYHFETQPIPGPLSRWFHFLPKIVLRAGVWFNYLAELIAPWLIFWPRIGRHIAGIIIVLFQGALILSGNLSFFNWLTIVPALACFDDGFWKRIFPVAVIRRAENAELSSEKSRPMIVTSWAVTILIGFLSIQPVMNILSPKQIMNTSFDPLDLVNTYGAFGWVGQERLNVVFEGTSDDTPDEKANWKAYHFKGLPVDLDKRPPLIAPYQLRLDWQMWFASMSGPDDYPWTLNLVWKLLHNESNAVDLFADNPFPMKPPKFIKATLYKYSFVISNDSSGNWWKRENLGNWLPAMSADDPRLIEILKTEGWLK